MVVHVFVVMVVTSYNHLQVIRLFETKASSGLVVLHCVASGLARLFM